MILLVSVCNAKERIPEEMLPDIAKTIDLGNELSSAIEKYKSHFAQYPDSLDELTPNYVEKIPVTFVEGNKFSYWKDPNTDFFSLAFRLDKASIFDIGARAFVWFEYKSDLDYASTERNQTYFIVNNWAYILNSRHKVGEGGRVEDNKEIDWSYIRDWCQENEYKCEFPSN